MISFQPDFSLITRHSDDIWLTRVTSVSRDLL